MTTAEKVRTEMHRFRERLPVLMESLAKRWVVFKDGTVASDHDTEEQAYRAGLTAFGRHGGHVIAQVVEQRSVPLSAAVVYRKRA